MEGALVQCLCVMDRKSKVLRNLATTRDRRSLVLNVLILLSPYFKDDSNQYSTDENPELTHCM